MMQGPSWSRSRSRGQTLVEFALVFPLFILLVFAVLDMGRAILAYNTVASAARNGARVAIVNQTSTGTIPVVPSACDTTSGQAWAVGCAVYSTRGTLAIDTSNASIIFRNATDTGPCSVMKSGCLAEVTVTAPFRALTPGISQLIGPITFSSTSKVPVERVCSTAC